MKIHEYQAKQLLKQYGVPVPQGQVASNPDEVREVAKTLGKFVVIKGQVHSGGRGKAGADKLAASSGTSPKAAPWTTPRPSLIPASSPAARRSIRRKGKKETGNE